MPLDDPAANLAPSLWFSLQVALMATSLAALVAIPAALWLARRRFPGRGLIETLLLLPLALPPTVVGYGLLVLFGSHGPLGYWIMRFFDYTILFNWPSAVIAAMVVSLPLLYLPARAAFAGVERDIEDAARVEGAGRWRVFFHVSLPMARRGIAAGVVLAFARALGEFGATIMVLGSAERHQTLPIYIYYNSQDPSSMAAAARAAVALSLIAFAAILIYHRLPAAGLALDD